MSLDIVSDSTNLEQIFSWTGSPTDVLFLYVEGRSWLIRYNRQHIDNGDDDDDDNDDNNDDDYKSSRVKQRFH